MLFRHNPYPEVAKGLAEYWMAPDNLRVTIEEGDGRWGPPYQGMYDSDFWKRPVFQHWRVMLERGRQFPHPGTQSPASGEVVATSCFILIPTDTFVSRSPKATYMWE